MLMCNMPHQHITGLGTISEAHILAFLTHLQDCEQDRYVAITLSFVCTRLK